MADGNKERNFKAIYLTTFDKLRRTIKSLRNEELINDSMQEAYSTLWLKFDEMEDDKDHMPFLYFYARNYALKQIGRDIKRELLENDLFRNEELTNADHDLDFKEYHFQLSRAIDRLPVKRREVYRLFKDEGLSYKSIGEKLCISYKTVDSHLAKASKTIKREIYSIYGIPTKLIFIIALSLGAI